MRKSERLYHLALQYAKDKIDNEFDGNVEKYLLNLLAKDNPKSAVEHVQQLQKETSGLKRKNHKPQKPCSVKPIRSRHRKRTKRNEPIPGQMSLLSNSH